MVTVVFVKLAKGAGIGCCAKIWQMEYDAYGVVGTLHDQEAQLHPAVDK